MVQLILSYRGKSDRVWMLFDYKNQRSERYVIWGFYNKQQIRFDRRY